MGYLWNGTSSRLTISGTPAVPSWLSGSLWFYPTDGTLADQMLFGQVNTTGAAYYGVFFGSTSAADKVYFGDSTTGFVQSGSAANLNAWNHVYWSYNSYAAPDLYQISLNGEALQTAVYGGGAPATTVATCVGFKRNGAVGPHSNWFAGYIAEISIYNDVMDVTYGDRYKALSKRWSPLRIMPDGNVTSAGLTHYWPLKKGLVDIISKRSLNSTVLPTIAAVHPKVFGVGRAQLVA